MKLTQRNQNPHKEHVAAIKDILRYLSRTTELKILYQHTGSEIVGYADADWGNDRRSYSGYAFSLEVACSPGVHKDKSVLY